MQPGYGEYAFDNGSPTSKQILDNLASIWDPFSMRQLRRVAMVRNRRAWSVGAGNGSIARWLADQGVHVIATDKDPRHVTPHRGVTVVCSDVTRDPAPGRAEFNLIHARCLLAHLPNRLDVLATLADALTPGGGVVIEDWGPGPGRVLTSPVPDAAAVYHRYQRALLEVLRSRGHDTTWAWTTADAMISVGLTGIEVETHARSWVGGTAGCMLPVAVATELREPLLEAGLTAHELDKLARILTNPQTRILGNTCFSTIGYRPE
jgi:SAM-dependent methyltransferase